MYLRCGRVRELYPAPFWRLRDVEGVAHRFSSGLARFRVWTFLFQFIIILAMPCLMQDLSSLTRD